MPSIIERLRVNPAAVCESNGIRTSPAGGSFSGTQEGGRCEIACTETGTGVYDLVATGGRGTDYFFPWLQRNYTWVKVPKDAADGTIVMTGGLNGCTIVVSEFGSDYYFYHDGDSKYLPSGTDKVKGAEVVRIVPDDYDPGDYVKSVFTSYLQSYAKAKMPIQGATDYGIFVIFVRVGGQFVACSSSVVSVGKPMALKGAEIRRF